MAIRRISAWTVFWSATSEQWKDASYGLAFTLGGGLLPVLIGSLVLIANHGQLTLESFATNGELALYAAAMCSPLLYPVVSDYKQAPFPNRPLFVLVAGGAVVCAVILYLLVAPALVGHTPLPATFDHQAFIGLTGWLFTFAFFLSIVVTIIDLARGNPQVDKIAAAQEKGFEKQFDDLEGK